MPHAADHLASNELADDHPLDFYPEEETGDELTDSLALIDKARAALALAETW